MSDSLKKGLNVPSFNFTTGALPEAIVFNTLYESVRSGFGVLNNLLGPLVRDGANIEAKDYIASTATYYSKMSSLNRTSSVVTAIAAVTNTFNLARILGSHTLLSPRYIPGSYHLSGMQGSGWPLRSDSLEQQLPFPPGRETGTIAYTLVTNGVSFSRKTTKAAVYESTSPAYYVDPASATLYSNCLFTRGESLKYDLYVPNTESYIGAGYNCIPDLSILSLSESTRTLYGNYSGDYGCLQIKYVNSTNDTAQWLMVLPKVISVKESILSYANGQGTQKLAAGFEPVGKAISGVKRYVIPNSTAPGNDIFSGSVLQENITILFDSRTGKSYPITLIKTENEIAFNFTTSVGLKNEFQANDGSLLSSSALKFNSKHFFLFTVATSLSASVAQNSINFSQHDHDGINSKRLSHKSLLHNSSELPAIPFLDRLGGESGGLDFLAYSRFLTDTQIPNDPHPQYLSRLGYKFGGSQGFYDRNPAYDSNSNKNTFFGDFVFYPMESFANPYQYETATNNTNSGERQEKITWDLDTNLAISASLRSHALVFGSPDVHLPSLPGYLRYVVTPLPVTVANSLASGLEIRIKIERNQTVLYEDLLVEDLIETTGGYYINGGANYTINDVVKVSGDLLGGKTPDNDLYLKVLGVIGGIVTELGIHPTLNSGKLAPFQRESNPNLRFATKLYYEPYPFILPGNYDHEGIGPKLSRHGFIPGNKTGALSEEVPDDLNIGGLNIGWGNLFFGHREDIFNGRLTGVISPSVNTEASTYWRTGEFNIVTTANSKAGTNTNSPAKADYQHRDGFALNAIKGSNIWLKVGGEGVIDEHVPFPTGKTLTGVPGSFALEISYPETMGESGLFGLKTRDYIDPEGHVIASGAGILSAPGPIVDRDANKFRVPWTVGYNAQHFAALWSSNDIGNPTLVGSQGGVYGAEYDDLDLGPGPILDIFSLAPDRNTSNELVSGRIGRGADSSILGWVYGRPFIRGTYGINFCLSGQLDNLHPNFKVGLDKFNNEEPWGPESAVLTHVDNNQYVHREFKFWGKITDVPAGGGFTNTAGGNINLLYKFGQSFNRWGLVKPWDQIRSMDGKVERDSINYPNSLDPAPWQNARRISLGSSQAEDYGSAIRQASFVEAFAGVRNDPYQPYTAEYVVPFKALYNFGPIDEDLSRIEEKLAKSTFALTGDESFDLLWPSDAYIPLKVGTLGTGAAAPSIFIDQLIRGSEDMLLARSGEHINAFNTFPISLQSVKVDLEYYIGQKVEAKVKDEVIRGTGDLDSPSKTREALTSYSNTLSGYVSAGQLIPGLGLYASGDFETGVTTITGLESSGQRSAWDTRFEYARGADYLDVINGTVVMVEGYKVDARSDTTSNAIPTLFKTSGHTPSVDPYNRDSKPLGGLVGYESAVGISPSTADNNVYFNRFPHFQSKYGGYMRNKMFCLMINFGRKLDNATNSPVPYRVFIGNEDGMERPYYEKRIIDPTPNTGTGEGAVFGVILRTGPAAAYDYGTWTAVDGRRQYNNDGNVYIDFNYTGVDGTDYGPGSGYVVGQYFNIPGSELQGIDGVNDLRVTITQTGLGGTITGVSAQAVYSSPFSKAMILPNLDYDLLPPEPAGQEYNRVWVEFKGRLTLKTITALERDPDTIQDYIPY